MSTVNKHTLYEVPQLQSMILAHTQRHLSRGMDTEIQDGVLVSAQDMHALPVVHTPDAQVEVLRYNAFLDKRTRVSFQAIKGKVVTEELCM